MKIAVWHNLPSGGGKRALYQHVRGLVERGHEVESWRLETADPSYLPLADFVTEHVVPFDAVVPPVRGRIPLLLGRSEVAERIRRMHAACAQCAREMEARGTDVVFAASCSAFLIPFIGLHATVPAVAYIQEPNRFLYEAGFARTSAEMLPWVPEPASRRPSSRLGRAVEREALARLAGEEWRAVHAFDRVLVNSRFSRESFLQAYAADSRVCYLGVDGALFTHSDAPRERFVVGLGSFHAIKGIDLVVRAAALVGEPRPAIVWIGNSADPAYLAEVTRLAASLGVDFQARVCIPDAEMVSLLGRATALVYASRLEPFGFAPLEANACGTPVVAVAEGGVRETVVDGVNGLLTDDRDPAALAGALERLLDDPARARAMGRRARDLVDQRWTVEQSVASVERHLTEVVGERADTGRPHSDEHGAHG